MGSIFNSMQISASGMSAQKQRMDVVAENIANAEATRTSEGGPYKKKRVVFSVAEIGAAGGSFGVSVSSVARLNKFKEVYDPTHPDANAKGIVKMPDINTVEEMVEMNSASRSFEANVTTMEASKRMFLKSLELMR